MSHDLVLHGIALAMVPQASTTVPRYQRPSETPREGRPARRCELAMLVSLPGRCHPTGCWTAPADSQLPCHLPLRNPFSNQPPNQHPILH